MRPKRFIFGNTALFGTTLRCGAPVFLGFTVLILGLDSAQAAIYGSRATGSGSSAPQPGAPAGGAPTPATNAAVRANAQDTLARTNQAVGAAKALQDAARAAAAAGGNNAGQNPNNPGQALPNVPDGLGTGGLQIAPGAVVGSGLWTGANLPGQTTGPGGKVDVTIKQTSQQALLTWESFNVGKNTTLTFDQSAGGANSGQWIAFNKINDPSGNPTQILGQIKAQGQVYIINRNGIIFGGSSQVNVRGLTVSSLPLNMNLVERGLLNNPDAQFLFSGLSIPAGTNGTPAFTPEAPPTLTGKYGDVIVQEGAQLTSPTNAAKTGGRVTLVGANVYNDGTISTPDGQTILASGLQVGFEGHSSSDPSLRGLDVYIGSVGTYGGTTTNNGLIESPRGSITIAGKNVNQSGVLHSTTSVSLNGRIDIQANYGAVSNQSTNAGPGNYFLYQNSGTVTLGADSVTRILPELQSTETTIGTELSLRSRINISGQAVYLGTGSMIQAPNAIVDITAGKWNYLGGTFPASAFVQTGGQIYLDENALIDVSGTRDVSVPVSRNILEIDLRGAELANSPLQRDGVLRNETIYVDIRDAGIYQDKMWVGTPLAEIAGYANLIQRTVAELTVAGGTVNLKAGGSVVMRAGSEINVSGGSINYEGGSVRTTLLTSNGQLTDIRDTRPDVVYDGIFGGGAVVQSAKWGVTEIYTNTLAPGSFRTEASYTQGAAGGTIAITAPSMALDGKFTGHTITGTSQRATPPAGSSLSLSLLAQDPGYNSLPSYSPVSPDITFVASPGQPAPDAFTVDANGTPLSLREDRANDIHLSSAILADSGIGNLTINNPDGNIIVPSDVRLEANIGGSITLTGSNLRIDGTVIAAGGTLNFKANALSTSVINAVANSPAPALPVASLDRGNFILGTGGVISTAGLVVDDRLSSATTSSYTLKGGSISINGYSTVLSEGGLIDVSGGVLVDAKGKVTYGNAGSISVFGGRETTEPAVLGGRLELGATFAGYSGATAGKLSLSAPAFQIGGSSGNANVVGLDAGFFDRGGFSSVALTGIGIAGSGTTTPGILITAGTDIRPEVESVRAVFNPDGRLELERVLYEEGVRATSTLSFRASGAVNRFAQNAILVRGDVVMESNSRIQTDGSGSVSFQGETVTIDGSVITPGGNITVTGASRYPSDIVVPQNALSTVWIGSEANLSAAGKAVLVENTFGLREGKVLAGGTISVSGNIVAEAGATLDVSGTWGILDLTPGSASLDPSVVDSLGNVTTVPVRIESNGGSITLAGSEMLHTAATLIGKAGGTSANGGSLNVSSGKFLPVGSASHTAEINLVVTQSGSPLPADVSSLGVGDLLLDSNGIPLPGIGNFAIDSFSPGGFGSLALKGNVHFEGNVSITAPGTLSVASGGVLQTDGNVDLTAGHIVLGQAFRAPSLADEPVILFTRTGADGVSSGFTFAPTGGSGNLTVKADLIDIGNLSLQGIGTAGFLAPEGDIRGNGTLSTAADLLFHAGQIYPTTAGSFSIFAYGGNRVTIQGGKQRHLPLSAGGSLSIFASEIHQGGTVRAPIGSIRLGYDGSTGTAPLDAIAGTTLAAPVTSQLTLASGSVTSVSAIDPITGKSVVIPYGISTNGTSWIDPAGNDITVGGLPGKSISLSSTALTSEKNSTIDISGGGDLYAYRWISGNGGTTDVLDTSGSFAIIPGYGFDYAPYAPFNNSAGATNLGGSAGYANSTLRAGDQITLAASRNLAAGTYTLLPARYALLPGAILITPKSGTPAGSVSRPDGSSLVSGYISNNLDPNRSGATRISNYEIAPAAVVRSRSQYKDLFANSVLKQAAIAREFTVPRLPIDAGYLSFTATTAMTLSGNVRSLTSQAGRGSVIDINSPVDILINQTGTGGTAGNLVLSSDLLNRFGAESLLIGGIRSFGTDGTHVTANTGSLILDNSGAALAGSDIILVAKNHLILEDDSEITGTGSQSVDHLILGNTDLSGSGNGALVRASGNASASVERRGVNTADTPSLDISAGASISGGSITLDSTFATRLDPSARLRGKSLSLSSGSIIIEARNAGALPANTALVLSGEALASLQQSAERLSLLSYSNLDIYGTGSVGSTAFQQLSLQASNIRGFNLAGGTFTFSAKNIALSGNEGNRVASGSDADGTLVFDAEQITLGQNNLLAERFGKVELSASNRLLTSGTGGFQTTGDLGILTPLVTGSQSANHRISSAGTLSLDRAGNTGNPTAGGLGSRLVLEASSLAINSNISLPSGQLTLRATTGDVVIGSTANTRIDAGGSEEIFTGVTRYSSGGTISLVANHGSVRLASQGTIDVGGHPGGGGAGKLNVETPEGPFELAGTIDGSSRGNNTRGSFTLDVLNLSGGALASIDTALNEGNFNRSRDYRIRTGDVTIDGTAISSTYRVSADAGNILVNGTIRSSGKTGGTIDLKASGSLTLASGSLLTVAANDFDNAGKGGAVTLEAGVQKNGVINPAALLDLRTGSTIDLSVASNQASSQSLGKFSGTLHLRAPRTAGDIQVAAIGSMITGASSLLVEGVKLYDLTGTAGALTTTLQNQIKSDATAYLGANGTTTAGYTAMHDRLVALNPSLDLILAPGVEITNRSGSLTLGTTTSTAASDWDFSSFRFGPLGAAGVLTLRASENIVLYNALSDGFSGGTNLWLSPLMANNLLLPANTQSWSYRLAAGADFSAVNFREVRSPVELAPDTGLLQLGKNLGSAAVTGGTNALTSTLVANNYQVIRTGSGNIDIATAGSVQLLNQFATIYTAGTQVASPTTVVSDGDFIVPILNRSVAQGSLGVVQQTYPAQYSMAGGNVTIAAGNNIEHKTRNNSGLIDDSSRQLPNNWLYRRGLLGSDGDFGSIRIGTGLGSTTDPAASTSWWVDFSNFFEGVGALGGGNVTLVAGNDVKNVDAVIPTNARAARGTPNANSFIELGGGDLTVLAGNDINAGVYYVERGKGVLNAGRDITTNSTRSPSFGLVSNPNNPAATTLDEETWLPTTLFVGKSGFDISAAGDVLLGPVSNPFLLPQALNNRFWYKTYFSTFSPDSYVNATSLGGDVTLRNAVTLPNQNQSQPMLRAWLETQQLFTSAGASTSSLQPWLRLSESSLNPFNTLFSVSSPNLSLTSLAGDLNLVGDITLFPSSNGQLELLSAGSINALQSSGISNTLVPGQRTRTWTSSVINISDANPNSVPSVLKPFTSFSLSGSLATPNAATTDGFLSSLVSLFSESGSFSGINAILQTKQARHTAGLLHMDDDEPIRIQAKNGSISGLTLFTPKAARISASRDITDIAFYIQNLAASDLSIVSAGRDLIAYNASSPLQGAAISSGNALESGSSPLAGDIQISGPGTLQVIAGRDIDLGNGTNNADGTGTGITSIGNLRNPYLTAEGADLSISAGLGPALSLRSSQLDWDAFIDEYVISETGGDYLNEVAPGVDFATLSEEEQTALALEIFYLILRDTGRDFNDPRSSGYRNYNNATAAIETLLGEEIEWQGEINTRARDIRTRSGGDISIFAPGGGLSLAETVLGNPLAPPGIITESGGNISIFTDGSVDIGIGRIFTLRGGDAIIWSTNGDIAAGSSSRTIQSAPPTRVVIDPQSASVQTDLAGLATGGGIGVLATVDGVDPGDVDLIAPSGTIDAGDAGIRVSGNINLAAVSVTNAGNISAGGSSTGAPASVSPPSVTTTTSAAAAAAATGSAADPANSKRETGQESAENPLSIITVEVIGYGGGPADEEDDDEEASPVE